ncbi:MAG TPA: response regulator transcription factor [Stellaceae bacterium]|jgi:two-component system nitrate/nitrite response regulator NarL|nr:response regulator transcription factor [Stellaceae bacterium]
MTGDTVLLIDANRLFREGVHRILSDASFAVLHQTSSVDTALPFIEALQPSLVLVDPPDSSEGTAGISQIRAATPRSRIVILTEGIRVNQLADSLAVGIDGYLLKTMSADALPQSLRLVLLGEKVFPTDLARLLTNGRIVLRGHSAQIGHVNGLSDREMQILGCLINGAQNKQIANELQISEGTVKVHVKAILKKIHVQNRTQAAVWALNHGVARDIGADLPRLPIREKSTGQ